MDISCLAEWNTDFEVELPILPSRRRQLGVDNELVELLWQNGEVVLQSQTHRKSSNDSNKSKKVHKHDDTKSRFVMTSTNLIQDEEAISWIHSPIDESFEELCSDFLSEIPSSNPVFEGENFFKFPSSQQHEFGPISLPPPVFEILNSNHQDQILTGDRKYSNLDLPVKRKEFVHMVLGDVHELSVMTTGSSHCGSNQVASSCGICSRTLSDKVDDANHVKKLSPVSDECAEIETLEQALTSCSRGSGSSFWKTTNQSNEINCHKRKSRDAELSDCLSDATELESGSRNKSSKKCGTARRSRVAEVHNLSERRRRDRINEKMRVLQELIPHSHKSDKASMLDEVIEYMKSLQSQIQFMWMGSQMAQMVIPGIQNYMYRAGMGISPAATIPQIHNLMRFSRLPQIYQARTVAPMANQTAVGPIPLLKPVSYPNQTQNPGFHEQYANYSSLYPMQNTSQVCSLGTPSQQSEAYGASVM
ncbi:transcription factor PHYTOCHROME INTERACTING FACTOR-LIKE 13-like isoform X1 [Primulina huaijiensis]|uniref:transcription factor PHYTOCHROME INTERACTING FACTOR-LIKE 13-like isoform X1 n=1 Tax=Primulina huaijiensis TaxID=1492673 RepID=UPI003CC7512D